jgi:glycosyltransferase involved in cell wall biosynthesis
VISINQAITKPRISVVTPYYNAGAFIEETVDSVLAQEGDFELAEILLVNDRSDDAESLDALDRVARHDVVRVLQNEGLRGPGATRNIALRAAAGDWIAFLDADDVWLPGSLADRLELASDNPDCQWVGGDYARLYDDGRHDAAGFIWTCSYNGPILRAAEGPDGICLKRPVEQFIRGYPTWTGTTIVRRDLLEEVGEFNETLIQAEDRELWMRLAAVADFYFVPKVIALYRQHDASIMRTPLPPDYWNVRAYRARLADEAFRPYRGALHEKLAQAYAKQARYFRQRREFSAAFRAYARLTSILPFRREGWRGMAASLIHKQ